MNCLYITIFFNIVAGIVQTFNKFWNQLLLSPRHRSLPPARDQRWPTAPLFVVNIVLPSANSLYHFVTLCHFITLPHTATICEFPLDVQLLHWEIFCRKTPRIWRDFGSAPPFQKRLTPSKPFYHC
jgi:hypothetical protein